MRFVILERLVYVNYGVGTLSCARKAPLKYYDDDIAKSASRNGGNRSVMPCKSQLVSKVRYNKLAEFRERNKRKKGRMMRD